MIRYINNKALGISYAAVTSEPAPGRRPRKRRPWRFRLSWAVDVADLVLTLYMGACLLLGSMVFGAVMGLIW